MTDPVGQRIRVKVIERTESQMKTLLATLNAKYTHTSLALNCLSSYVRKRGWEVEREEYTINQPRDGIVRELCLKSPDILGMSLYIWNIEKSLSILSDIHLLLPETILILGGPEASDGLLESLPETLQSCAILVRGEGEESLCQVLKALDLPSGCRDGGAWSREALDGLKSVAGISFFCKGSLIHMPEQAPLALDSLSFPYGKEELTAQKDGKIFYYEASRGCPFRCGYCLSSLEKTLRYKPLAMVLEELSVFLEAGVRQVKFVDRTFNCDKAFAMGIWKFLIEKDNHTTNFHFEASADLLDEDMLNLLEQARPGLFQLEIGIQSTRKETLEAVNRHTNVAQAFKAIRRILEAGNIHVHLDLIAGLPLEGYEDFQRSFNDVYALGPHQLQLGFLKLLRGTMLEREKGRWGLKASAAAPYEVLETDSMPFADFCRLKNVEEMVEGYYNRGQFRYSLAWAQTVFPTAFALYEALGQYWRERIEGSRQVRFTEYYTIFRECMADYMSDGQRTRLDWLLKLDLYCRDKAKSLPDWMAGLDVNKTYEEEIRRFYRRLPCPDGSPSPVRPSDPRTHLEILPFDPSGQGERAVVLLLYRQRDLWGNARLVWIPWKEFIDDDKENGANSSRAARGIPRRAL